MGKVGSSAGLFFRNGTRPAPEGARDLVPTQAALGEILIQDVEEYFGGLRIARGGGVLLGPSWRTSEGW